MDITGTITALTAAMGFARELHAVNAQLDQATLKLKIAELTSALADAKIGLTDVADQLREKDAEIARLSALKIDLSKKVVVRGFHLDSFEDGTPKGDAYCPYCIERSAGLFRIHVLQKPGYPSACPSCKTEYRDPPAYSYEQG